MLPDWLLYMKHPIQQLPSPDWEDFFDNASFESGSPELTFTFNNSLKGWQWLQDILDYKGTWKEKVSRKNYLLEKMGLIAIEVKGQQAKVVLNPAIYRQWYDTEYQNLVPMQLDEVAKDKDLAVSESQAAKQNVEQDSKQEIKQVEQDSKQEPLTDMALDETPDKNSGQVKKGGGVKKRKVDTSIKKQKMEKDEDDDSDFEQDKTAVRGKKPRNRTSGLFHPVTKQSDGKTLTISNLNMIRLQKATAEVFEKMPLTLGKAATALKAASQMGIRPIKKSEHGYIKTNYMVNIVNKENGLQDIEALVKAGGYLSSEDKTQYYYVLVSGEDVIGHLVFYHNKTDPETVKVPAFEVSLSSRGMRLGELLMLFVMQFCVDNNVPAIVLETGHHENSGHLAAELTKGMRKFYCKLGFRLEGEDVAQWDQKNVDQKLLCFKQENDQCVFDFSKGSKKLALDEAEKALFAYAIKDAIISILQEHVKYFKGTYDIHDLISCKEYTNWLIQELTKTGLVAATHIETCLILISNEKKSKEQIKEFDVTAQKMKDAQAKSSQPVETENKSTEDKNKSTEDKPSKDYGPLLAAIPKPKREVEQKAEVSTETKAKVGHQSLLSRRRRTPQVEEDSVNNTRIPSSNKTV